ncbi:MutS protein-like 4 [Durusdinium trenchii]|uniref:MutS protein-like 4 n=1 Tax=Durusdinium trenchii TaxID=1381693 RepID=A0ABP0RAM6_9DINO
MAFHRSALTVKSQWLALLLSGEKTWEIRTKNCRVRGDVAVMASGSSFVYGFVEIVDCQKRSPAELSGGKRFHLVPDDEIEKYTNGQAAYAWVISRPRILVRPLAVRRAQSSINWVKLDDGSIQELQQRAAYDGSAAMAAAIRSDMAQVERQRRRPGRRRSSSARERLVAGLMAEADDFWSEGDGVVNEVTASMQIFQNLCAWLLYGPKPPMKLMRKLLLQSARGLNEQLLKLRSPEEADKVQQLRWCFELYHRLESLPRPNDEHCHLGHGVLISLKHGGNGLPYWAFEAAG